MGRSIDGLSLRLGLRHHPFESKTGHFPLSPSSSPCLFGVYEELEVWEVMKQKLRDLVTLPDQPPDCALAPSNPERPVRIHLVTHMTMGGVDIYRL